MFITYTTLPNHKNCIKSRVLFEIKSEKKFITNYLWVLKKFNFKEICFYEKGGIK